MEMMQQPMIDRDNPNPPEARAALVKRWLTDIEEARKHWGPDFKRMRRNMKFAAGKQWPGQKEDDPRYRVNLVQRILKQTVSSLYAKNPTVTHKRRNRMEFALWDGSPEALAQAQQAMAMAAQLADPATAAMAPEETAKQVQRAAIQAQALLEDVQQGLMRIRTYDKVGKTLVALLSYYINEDEPTFKGQMKRMVRRARTTGVGYVGLEFQREMELTEEQTSRVAEFSERMAVIQQMAADLQDGEIDPNAAEAEELRLAVQAIQSEPERIVREGLVWRFPLSTRIIPSVSTQALNGWIGCEWLAEEIMLSPDRIKRIYGKDVSKSYVSYRTVAGSPDGGDTRRQAGRKPGSLACVYRVWDKETGTEFVVCEGYDDFLKEPASPAVFIEQFFPIFAITFNDVEDEGRLFPDSDVENITHPQMEFNRTKEALRQHRIANRPLYVSPNGSFDEEEQKSLATYAAHDVIMLNKLAEGRPVTDVLQPMQKIGIDPNLYETNTVFEDMQRATGNAEANLGGIAGGTATESSIAESSRQGGLGLDGDDLDDMLSAIFRAAGAILLAELDETTVKEIVGPGAVWPELSRQEIARELWLDIKGGSSGRPNQAQEAARFERVAPFLMQIPGISPRWLAERAVRIADGDIDLEEAIAEGLPSITQMNGATRPGTGDPATDPAQQGDRGGDPQQPKKTGDNGQPGFTPPSQ